MTVDLWFQELLDTVALKLAYLKVRLEPEKYPGNAILRHHTISEWEVQTPNKDTPSWTFDVETPSFVEHGQITVSLAEVLHYLLLGGKP